MRTTGLEKYIAVGDNHGILIDKKDSDFFIDFCKDFKPKHKIHLGDNWDFANLRRGADPKEEGDDMEPDVTAGYIFLEKFHPTVFLLGNHDARLWKLREDARGLVRMFAEQAIAQVEKTMKQMNCLLLPYHFRDGVYTLGDQAFIHGFHCGVGAVRQHAMIYRRVMHGHLHRNEEVRVPGLDEATGTCVAGIGNHSAMNYASHRTATSAWGKGFGIGYYNPRTGKTVESRLIKKENGQWPSHAI